MSILINESYANPTTPLWASSIGGGNVGFYTGTSTQVDIVDLGPGNQIDFVATPLSEFPYEVVISTTANWVLNVGESAIDWDSVTVGIDLDGINVASANVNLLITKGAFGVSITADTTIPANTPFVWRTYLQNSTVTGGDLNSRAIVGFTTLLQIVTA